MKFTDLVPVDRHQEIKTLADQIKGGIPVRSFKTQRQTKDGKILNIWLTTTVLRDEKGQPLEMSTTERDMAWLAEG